MTDARPTPDLPGPSDLIAGLADGTLAVGTLSGFEIAGVVKELMRRNSELEAHNVGLVADLKLFGDALSGALKLSTAHVAERDALLRRLVRRTYEGDGWYAQDGGRYALTNHGWGFYRTEAEAIEAVRRAVGLDEQGEG